MPVLVAAGPTPRANADVLEIGLLNNLSDAGLKGGERQFIDLLTKAAGTREVRLRLYSLPDIVRGPDVRARIETIYTRFETLFSTRLDGLIVTGCEPVAARLRDEPFWPHLARVVDWARHNTRSTVWSCLAAHAAVLHLDGIERRRLPEKYSGVFAVERASANPLLAGAGSCLQVPHSRYNDLAETDLVAAGYEILTRSATVGVDAFAMKRRSLFLFLQGHPEYDADTLLREYRRDVMRFLDGSSEIYPTVPKNVLSRDMEDLLRMFAMQARFEPAVDLFSRFPLASGRNAGKRWNNDGAVALFANWLATLHARTPEHVA